ncbi:16S rRNA (guanine(527)-N(7))-methyltransferase RsmG [Candidatus Nesciobacter abundans]|uniref:16S rRNA (guanine(527)-N(7))-methyltransferase RsmG n=1 Tax=Candidatus Nesciobacter abundans TaxID=2601668 RepID=UPI001653998F|nr:RsmG family class I SAM-dependent methyltransferase [Candidatus Nesciobacter abundans]
MNKSGKEKISRIFDKDQQTKLDIYMQMILDWQPMLHLVSTNALQNLRKHILDSAYLLKFMDSELTSAKSENESFFGIKNITEQDQLNEPKSPELCKYILDFGSGNGFPGVILAILGLDVILVEIHKKKCIFLDEVKIKLELNNLQVYNSDIRNFNLQSSNSCKYKEIKYIVTKGFGKVDKCIEYTEHIWSEDTVGLFIKSNDVESELEQALTKWNFNHKILSRYMPGFVLELKNLRKI